MNVDELAKRAHQEWLGYLQPSGLVVSPPALVAAQAFPQKNIILEQQRLIDLVGETDPEAIADFPRFTREFLGWAAADLAGGPGGPELPEALTVALPEYGESLRPTYAVPDPENAGSWLLLIGVESAGTDLDRAPAGAERRWSATPQLRFERLLRETAAPVGLLTGGTSIRLVYAPRGESSGFITFPVAAMCEVAGRPIAAAFHMLLSAERLFTVPTHQRLPGILRESRKYQNEVSTRLAGQVLAALYELLRGFQAANESAQGELLRDVLREAPQEVYGGLLGTLLRLVFVLYAEDRGLLSGDPVYQEHYSVGGLFERLRDDNARYPDTMKDRFGAWTRLLTLFRLIHDGAAHGTLRLPARHGRLFDPDTWDFLEGRAFGDVLDRRRRLAAPPRVPDGVVYRVLENLIVLDGERISYRALDVEQIGSVYEAMMGFELRVASGPSIALRPEHVVVDLAELLAAKPGDRVKRLAEEAACKLTGKAAEAVKEARTVDDLVAALEKRISKLAPQPVPKGGLLLQPTDERRRSGSHYTPRSLTEPIVRTTLDPILKALGESPLPQPILALKVCDPAMGSGAFLVEACRYLGDALVAAWQAHGQTPAIPPDEDPFVHARRLVAASCLYGVDKNVFAVDLAKLSLWLATLARDHPFTFLDHALRHGDSLVGLTREQIASFHWTPGKQIPFIRPYLTGQLKQAEELRLRLLALGDEGDSGEKDRLHKEAVRALRDLRLCADLVIAAFFGKEKDKDRENLRLVYEDQVKSVLEDQQSAQRLEEIVAELYRPPKPVPPFHWEIEFPEVFSRENPGFDAFVGNPPFLGGKRISTILGDLYRDWLATLHEEASSNTDLIAHFFRRVFTLARRHRGAAGLVATKTIAQGDTRRAGLAWIARHDGIIFTARKRVSWPGSSSVIVSIVHFGRGIDVAARSLEGRVVEHITAFLLSGGSDGDPAPLRANQGGSFVGCDIKGQGFVFDDDDPDASPLAVMRQLLSSSAGNQDIIFPYLGGEELNNSPRQMHSRYVIYFGEMTEQETRRWPDVVALVESKVKRDRQRMSKEVARWPWWRFWRPRRELQDSKARFERVLVTARVGKACAFAFVPSNQIFSEKVVVFPTDATALFSLLQSRAHEEWARTFSATLGDTLQYAPSDCFETFPFPGDWEPNQGLVAVGHAYHALRATLMVRNNEGLTKTYNRFHDPDERDPDILKLRELHDAMDRAVLDAYGWTDLQPRCEFLLDYEDEDPQEDAGAGPRRRKPWRYRWPDEFRDAVLARLLALNQERAKEEALSGAAAAGDAQPKRGRKRGKSDAQGRLPV